MGHVDLEYALLADHAEVVSGKLYLMGGGWDVLQSRQAPIPLRFSVALGVRVGWDETNQVFPVTVRVEDDDGAVHARAQGSVSVGRPPSLPPGWSQLAKLAVTFSISLPRFGGYRVLVEVGEGSSVHRRSLPFRVVPAGSPTA